METNNKLNEAHLLPMVQINGRQYLIDIAERGFRKAEDPEDLISFYTEAGRKMVRQCTGTEWRRYGLYPVSVKQSKGKMIQCNHCDSTVGTPKEVRSVYD